MSDALTNAAALAAGALARHANQAREPHDGFAVLQRFPAPWSLRRIGAQTALLDAGGGIMGFVGTGLTPADAALVGRALRALPYLLGAARFSHSVHRAQGGYYAAEREAIAELAVAIGVAEGRE